VNLARLTTRVAQAVLSCSALALAQPTVSITLYPTGGLTTGSVITTGPDGALWFTAPSGNNVGRISTSGAISQFSLPNTITLNGIAAGTDGALWLATGVDGIGRITTSGAFTQYIDKTDFVLTNSITAGPDGALWFTDEYYHEIGRITTGGQFTAYLLPGVSSGPSHITTGPDGALWFIQDGGAEIGRITTAGAYSFWTIPSSGAGATSIAAGPDGAMWFAENGTSKIGRLTTTGGTFTEYQTKDEYPAGITAGADGALWFTVNDGTVVAELGRITTGGTITYASLPTLKASQAITSGPDGALWLIDFNGNSIARAVLGGVATQVPAVSSGGVVSASAFGAFPKIAPGTWIEIYGSNLAYDSRSWASADFNGENAPTSLDAVSVTVGGQAAFIDYISPGQINALVPSNAPTGSQQVVVTTALGTSAPYQVTVNATEPGLLAPSSFDIGGTQYAVALFTDGVTYVLPTGAIPGIASRPANPGDTIVLYGIGFGAVVPNTPAGQLVQASNTLAASFQVSIGGIPAVASYAGLAPGYTGLYQFNIVVPNVAAGNAAPLTFTLGGATGTQTLYLAVAN
jgi:virginiamycin B lyase